MTYNQLAMILSQSSDPEVRKHAQKVSNAQDLQEQLQNAVDMLTGQTMRRSQRAGRLESRLAEMNYALAKAKL